MTAVARYQFDGHRPATASRPRWVDTDKEWRPKVRELADELGYQTKGVWYWFRQISLCVFHELRWPQECAEAHAFHCCRLAFDKRGQEPS